MVYQFALIATQSVMAMFFLLMIKVIHECKSKMILFLAVFLFYFWFDFDIPFCL